MFVSRPVADDKRHLSLSTKIDMKQVYPIVLLIVSVFFQGCASDNKKTSQQTPATTTTPISQEPDSNGRQEEKESPLGKSVEEIRKNKTNRIGTVPTEKDAAINPAPVVPPSTTTAPIKKSAPAPGPTAYTNKANVVLQKEPTKDAAKTRSFKIYEQVFILETKMTDDAGNATQFPTWYRVQCSDKKEGWVVASSVTLN